MWVYQIAKSSSVHEWLHVDASRAASILLPQPEDGNCWTEVKLGIESGRLKLSGRRFGTYSCIQIFRGVDREG